MGLKAVMSRLAYPHKKSALRYFLQDPFLMFALPREPTKMHLGRSLERAFGENIVNALHNFLPQRFLNHIQQHQLWDRQGYRLLFYLLVRKYKPDVIVETGVGRGVSSAYILCAMQENDKGHLYSIDLPPESAAVDEVNEGDHVRHQLADGQRHKHYEVGYFVPEFLRNRWTLTLGDARKHLPPLLEKLERIDIFYHDSLHTYDHMTFEFETAWPHLRDGGLLLSDDVLWNRAFFDICKQKRKKPVIYRTFGIVEK